MDTIYVGDYRGNWVIKIGGHVITKLILTVESVCAQPVEEGQPCTDLDMSDLVDIDEALDGVQINLLQVLDNEPVFFSKFAIPLGTYWDVELNLVPDMQFIEIDGGTHRLNLSNGGNVLVLFGKYTLDAEGGLFNLYFDFVASENIAFMPGIGYTLRSALLLNQMEPLKEITAQYAGFLPALTLCGAKYFTIFSIGENNGSHYFMAESQYDTKHPISGIYSYDSFFNVVTFGNVQLNHTSKCKRTNIGKNKEEERFNDHFSLPSPLPISEWSENQIVFGGCGSEEILLKRCNADGHPNCDEACPVTTVWIKVAYPNSSMSGKEVAIQIKQLDDESLFTHNGFATIVGNSAMVSIDIPCNDFMESLTSTFSVIGYLSEPDRLSISNTGSVFGTFIEKSYSDIKPPDTLTLSKGASIAENAPFEVRFPERIIITATPEDFSSAPTFSWNSISGVHSYLVSFWIEDRYPNTWEGNYNPDGTLTGDGSKEWDFVDGLVTDKTSFMYEERYLKISNGDLSDIVPIDCLDAVSRNGYRFKVMVSGLALAEPDPYDITASRVASGLRIWTLSFNEGDCDVF